MTNEIDQIERINTLLEKYLISFGQARIALYVFPYLENHNDFTRFLNAFSSALRRANCRPVYSWSYDSIRGCYNMMLIVSGYFRSDMTDITDAAQRIWKLYSPFPVQFVADLPVDYATIEEDKTALRGIMNGMQFTSSGPQRLLPPHQRSFACSKLY